MAILLYRPGSSHNINGIKCEMGTFNEYSFMHELENGWFYTPGEWDAEPEEVEPEEVIEEIDPVVEEIPEEVEPVTTFEQVDINKSGKLNPTEVRIAAKDAGMENWEKARIRTLKKQLGI